MSNVQSTVKGIEAGTIDRLRHNFWQPTIIYVGVVLVWDCWTNVLSIDILFCLLLDFLPIINGVICLDGWEEQRSVLTLDFYVEDS